MTVSDANPVQFWPDYCDTYNETTVAGVHTSCWCQPFNCDDEIKIQVTDSALSPLSLVILGENGSTIATITFTQISARNHQASFTPNDYSICDEEISLEIRYAGVAQYKSDCLDIKTFHEGTKLIEYSNERNYAGLVYVTSSPEEVFYIRVPCRFFHERCPEEDEAMKLSTSVITTSAELKAQKLLEVVHAPYYFHRKLQLILKHQSLEIDNTQWKKEEAYTVAEGNKRWPLKSATCYLTDKNSVVRNVL